MKICLKIHANFRNSYPTYKIYTYICMYICMRIYRVRIDIFKRFGIFKMFIIYLYGFLLKLIKKSFKIKNFCQFNIVLKFIYLKMHFKVFNYQ